jgi:hypothetical protein
MSFNITLCLFVFAVLLGLLIEDTLAQYYTFGIPAPYGGGTPPFGVLGKREAIILTANGTSA